jgi:hypothetical protein
MISEELVTNFIEAASSPIGPGSGWHGAGDLETANIILQAQPDLSRHSFFAAVILGDELAVHQFLTEDPEKARAKGGPRNWDALTYLCFSRYLRMDKDRSEGFTRVGASLLNAGADAKTGFFAQEHLPKPEWESVLYGAAGVAHHAGLTRLLLKHGADPNDEEVPYHSPETYDNSALATLIDSKLLTSDSLATMLLRKADWHDLDGMRLLLEAGADPNQMTRWGFTALLQALRRDNRPAIIELLLENGADPRIKDNQFGFSGISIAIHRGRADALRLFQQHGIPVEPQGAERLVYACLMDDTAEVQSIVATHPEWLGIVRLHGGQLLAEFAGNANATGIVRLLELGIPITALYGGDGYYGIPPHSMALHVAAWKGWHAAVQTLVDWGAPVDAPDGKGQTPLMLAIRACVDSYWMNRRSPASVNTLLRAGASVKGVKLPTGYEEIDTLLRAAGA